MILHFVYGDKLAYMKWQKGTSTYCTCFSIQNQVNSILPIPKSKFSAGIKSEASTQNLYLLNSLSAILGKIS